MRTGTRKETWSAGFPFGPESKIDPDSDTDPDAERGNSIETPFAFPLFPRDPFAFPLFPRDPFAFPLFPRDPFACVP